MPNNEKRNIFFSSYWVITGKLLVILLGQLDINFEKKKQNDALLQQGIKAHLRCIANLKAKTKL